MTEDNPWIYESPDNGTIVLRRNPGSDVRWMSLDGEWILLSDMAKIVKLQKEEEKLRKQYPVLAEAYDTYRTMLALCTEGKTDGTD